MAVAVEIDSQLIGGIKVERYPVLYAGHVDVFLKAEIRNLLRYEKVSHALQVLSRIDVIGILLGAGTGIGGHIGLLEHDERLWSILEFPLVRAGNFVDGERQHIGDSILKPGYRNLEFGGGGRTSVTRHHRLGSGEFVCGAGAHHVGCAVNGVVCRHSVGIRLEGDVKSKIRHLAFVCKGAHHDGSGLGCRNFQHLAGTVDSDIEDACHRGDGLLLLLVLFLHTCTQKEQG